MTLPLITACRTLRRACTQLFAAGLLAALASTVAAQTLPSKLPKEIRDRGVLRVAINDGGTPPMIYIAADNRTVDGLEPDLMQAMAELLNIKIEYTRSKFDGLIPAIKSGRADFAASSIGDLKARQTQVDFVDYFKAGIGLMVHKGNLLKLDGIGALCGVNVAVIRGTYQENEVIKQSKKCTAEGKKEVGMQTFADPNSSVLAMRSKRVDAWLADAAPVGYVVKQSSGEFELAGATATIAYLGLATDKGKTELRDALKAALDELVSNGTYQRLCRKWGQEANMVDAITINNALL